MGQANGLNHLTAEQIEELIAAYYGGENVHKLIERFGLDCSSNTLWRLFPAKKLDQRCRICGAPLWEERLPRTQYLAGREHPPCCSHCGHTEGVRCRCPACKRERAEQAIQAAHRERAEIEEYCVRHWDYQRRHIQPDELSLKAAVALIALVRSGGWEDNEDVSPWGTSGAPWTPAANSFRRHLLNTLLDELLIAPSPTASPDAFPKSSDGGRKWDPERVNWVILHPSPSQFLRQLVEKAESEDWPDEWHQSWKDLGLSLARAECWEFCRLNLERRDLPMPGEKALNELITDLLRHFSVSRCYRLLWMGAARATDAMARRNLNRQHAANYVIGACQRLASSARAEGWDLKGFARDRDLPRSEMSHVLHDVFLKHGEDGFYKCPVEWPTPDQSEPLRV